MNTAPENRKLYGLSHNGEIVGLFLSKEAAIKFARYLPSGRCVVEARTIEENFYFAHRVGIDDRYEFYNRRR